MPAFADLMAPVPVLTVLVLVRYGPAALVTVVAGMVAALTRNSDRGRRALAVLRLVQTGKPERAREEHSG